MSACDVCVYGRKVAAAIPDFDLDAAASFLFV